MIDLKPAALAAMEDLPACIRTSYQREDTGLPIITISDYMGRVLAQADGEAYLEEAVLAVDVYAAGPAEMETLAAQADQALNALGLRRVYTADLYDETAYAYHKALRYRALLRGEILYQS